MKYFDQYESKWGFDDGDSVPPDAEAHWVQNMRLMNAMLEKCRSGVRLVCWFRNGMHNCYLLLRVSKEMFGGLEEKCRKGGDCSGLECFQGAWEEAARDDAWHDAYEAATELYSEGVTFVDTVVELDAVGMDEFCRYMASGMDAEDAWREVTGMPCKRCGSVLPATGLCPDETCPYSDRQQYETFTEE